jgi:paired amphipathic helix protein Sin3a
MVHSHSAPPVDHPTEIGVHTASSPIEPTIGPNHSNSHLDNTPHPRNEGSFIATIETNTQGGIEDNASNPERTRDDGAEPSNHSSPFASQQAFVDEALGYIRQVKMRFSNNPNVYEDFLEVLNKFKAHEIDTPAVMYGLIRLLSENPDLICNFNMFMPPGYRMDYTSDYTTNAVRVTTPTGSSVCYLPWPHPTSQQHG